MQVAVEPLGVDAVADRPADRRRVVPVRQPALGGVDHVRALRDAQQAAPLGAAVAGVGQPLVPALRPQRQQAGMPPADVALVVGDHRVLVPGHLGDRAVGVGDRVGLVEVGDPGERVDLVVPDRVLARPCRALAGARLDRAVHGPAQAPLDGLLAGDLEGLGAAVHLAHAALVAVALGPREALRVQVVVVELPLVRPHAMWSLRPMPTTGRPGGVTPRASSPGRWTSNSASCSGIWKPSCGPVNSHARPLPRTAQASEPPRTSAAAAPVPSAPAGRAGSGSSA